MRDYESISSLTTFQKCPYAYKLSYIDLIPATVPAKLEFGRWVHKQIENFLKGNDYHEDAKPFIHALKDNLGSEIIAIEKEFYFDIEGITLKGIIDAESIESIFEFKVTSSPGYYISSISYQLKTYSFISKKQPIYLLFEIDKRKQSLKKVHKEYIPITQMAIEEHIKHLQQIIKMLKSCYENNTFPPSYNNCATCFYKDKCSYYFGW